MVELTKGRGNSMTEGRLSYPDLGKFKNHLLDLFAPSKAAAEAIQKVTIDGLYTLAGILGIQESDFAGVIAEYLNVPHVKAIGHQVVHPDVLPLEFCRWNSVVPVLGNDGGTTFLVSNPFNWELINVIKKHIPADRPLQLAIVDPRNMRDLLNLNPEEWQKQAKGMGSPASVTVIENVGPQPTYNAEQPPAVFISNNILYTAVVERSSDVHIEPKEDETLVRFRVDGDLRDIFRLKRQTGAMVISRLKALSGLDIAERLKPQDGAIEVMIDKRMFKLRLATTSTPSGESLIIRILEPTARAKELSELGMTEAQVREIMKIARHRYGLILVVGPTGSGKTTTIYSFLAHVDTRSRSLISVEDPVEYRIPNANQQQVNEKAGVTFDSLLKSSVRQDPDILFLGEVRDAFSARISVDFASTGHITISTLHTSNATTAIFRLERLGVVREVMAESLLAIIAQRLMKKLCPECKRVVPITEAEAELLRPFSDDLPDYVAHPVGCSKCRDGYFGREGIYEIITFDDDLLERIRTGVPISELREFIQRRGGYLISNHAVDKIKALVFPVKDVYEKVLVEEVQTDQKDEEIKLDKKKGAEQERAKSAILIVEDDADNRLLISHILTGQGYDVSVAGDGIDALMMLGQKEFDLIISDVNMPNLDGFKFLEIINQKGIRAPLIFLTARSEEEDEIKGLELGAVDYLKKPIKKEALLLRVKRALRKRE